MSIKSGKNQLTSTKYATELVCDAIELINSGRINLAKKTLIQAVTLLPEIDHKEQVASSDAFKKYGRGIAS